MISSEEVLDLGLLVRVYVMDKHVISKFEALGTQSATSLLTSTTRGTVERADTGLLKDSGYL